MRESVDFGACLPQDVRAIAKIVGLRKIRDVIRHKRSNCDFAWLGLVSLGDYTLIELCPDYGSSSNQKASIGIKTVSEFCFFWVDHTISRMHCSRILRAYLQKIYPT